MILIKRIRGVSVYRATKSDDYGKQGRHLLEPSPEDLEQLIDELAGELDTRRIISHSIFTWPRVKKPEGETQWK